MGVVMDQVANKIIENTTLEVIAKITGKYPNVQERIERLANNMRAIRNACDYIEPHPLEELFTIQFCGVVVARLRKDDFPEMAGMCFNW